MELQTLANELKESWQHPACLCQQDKTAQQGNIRSRRIHRLPLLNPLKAKKVKVLLYTQPPAFRKRIVLLSDSQESPVYQSGKSNM